MNTLKYFVSRLKSETKKLENLIHLEEKKLSKEKENKLKGGVRISKED